MHLQLGMQQNAHFIGTAYTEKIIFARLTKCLYVNAIAISYGSVGKFSTSHAFFKHSTTF